MSERKAQPRAPTYDDAMIADLAERVYRAEIGGVNG